MSWFARRGNEAGRSDALRRSERALLPPIVAASLLIMGTVAGLTQEPADCGHPVPDRSIRDCSLLIERGGVTADTLAEFHLLRGIAYFMKEEADRALADFDAVIRLAPTKAAPYAGRGDIHYQKGQYERAVADYEEAFRRNPNDAVVYFARHMALKKLGRPTVPPDGLKQPPHLEFHFAMHLESRHDLIVHQTAKFRARVESEFAALDRAISLDPKDGVAYVKRAQAFLQFGETLVEADRIVWEEDQAIPNLGGLQAARVLADYDQAVRVSPTLAEAFLARGFFFFRRGDYDRAIADLSEALRLRPGGDAYISRGKAYFKKKDYDRALADFDEAIRRIPKVPELYHRRGRAHAELGERPKAIADFRKAIETGLDINQVYSDANDDLQRLGVSRAEIRLWEVDYTIERHQHGIAKAPIVIGSAYFDRCLYRINKGEYDLATQDCDQAFRLYPDGVELNLRMRARAFIEKAEFDRAIADLSRAIEMKPRDSGRWFDRAEVHVKKGEFDRAIADFTEVLRLGPSNLGALIARGKAHAQKRDYARAIADFDEAIRQRPDREFYYYRGSAYEQLGEQDKAIADYRKVLSLDRGPVPPPEFDLSEQGLKRLGATR